MITIYPKQVLKRITIIACGCISFACDNGNSSTTNNDKLARYDILTQWTQVGGTNIINNAGNYEVNPYLPGGREQPNTLLDSSGNLWMFGGFAFDSANSFGAMNDLWQYNTSNSKWLWKSGSSINNALASFGNLGITTSNNVPGSRGGTVSWVDNNGNFWLFGGWGFTTTATINLLNDFWQYNPTTSLWTWMGGSNTSNAAGVYGTKGQTADASANIPGARFGASSWVANNGNFLLFGGKGNTTAIGSFLLNDLWIYDFSLSPNAWVWISGANSQNQIGTYPATPSSISSSTYILSGRNAQSSWMDSTGNLWIFGGWGYDSTGSAGYLNDLWMCVNPVNYNSTTPPAWAWVSGSKTNNKPGVYGVLSIPLSTNVPGGRYGANNWTDRSGNFWLFGGYGCDSDGNIGYLNDLWMFNPNTSQWTWVGGSNVVNSYGTTVGARVFAGTWFDQSGKLWLFGGKGYNNQNNLGHLNDFWVFNEYK